MKYQRVITDVAIGPNSSYIRIWRSPTQEPIPITEDNKVISSGTQGLSHYNPRTLKHKSSKILGVRVK